jgi:alcohol dehydrogenase class IV
MDEETKRKDVFSDHMMVPCCIILDPAITVHTPEWLWLSTGVRAVDHAVEALASLQSNFYADGMADSGLRLLVQGLAAVKRNPRDLEARLQCQVGAWQASVPFSVGVPLGASHAIGHGLGGLGVAHGYTSCVVMPHVQDWNADAIPERHQRIRECLGHPERPVGESLDRFISSLGMPRRLRDVGLSELNVPRIAEIAWAARWCRTNPKPITNLETVEQIVRLIPV